MSTEICLESKDGDSFLRVNGVLFADFTIIKEFPPGANGRVFLVQNTALSRKEVIKVWLKLREGDSRDKLEQGLAESQKLSLAAGEFAVSIYSFREVNNLPVANLEYIDGEH